MPTGAVNLDAKQQRTGLLVSYSKDAHQSTGGTSHLLGMGSTYVTEVRNTTGTSLASTAGTVQGSKAGVDITGAFSVTLMTTPLV